MSLALSLPPAADLDRMAFLTALFEAIGDRVILAGVREALRPEATDDDRAMASAVLRIAGHPRLAAQFDLLEPAR